MLKDYVLGVDQIKNLIKLGLQFPKEGSGLHWVREGEKWKVREKRLKRYDECIPALTYQDILLFLMQEIDVKGTLNNRNGVFYRLRLESSGKGFSVEKSSSLRAVKEVVEIPKGETYLENIYNILIWLLTFKEGD